MTKEDIDDRQTDKLQTAHTWSSSLSSPAAIRLAITWLSHKHSGSIVRIAEFIITISIIRQYIILSQPILRYRLMSEAPKFGTSHFQPNWFAKHDHFTFLKTVNNFTYFFFENVFFSLNTCIRSNPSMQWSGYDMLANVCQFCLYVWTWVAILFFFLLIFNFSKCDFERGPS